MYKNITDFFNKNLKHIKVDKHLIKTLKKFRLDWATKNSDYIDFLGGKLVGVHQIRFSILDDEKLVVDDLKIRNYKHLQTEIFKVPDLKKEYKIASNIIYQILMYLAHRFYKSSLNKKDKDAGIREVCLIMQYKMFSSIYGWYFKFQTTHAIANTVYNKLSHKFLIKQLGSWQEVFEYRVETCMDKSNPNFNRIAKYDTLDSIRIISDIQTKLREQIKQIFRVLVEVLDNKEIISQESSTFVGGENNEEQIRDITSGVSNYVTFMKNIAFNTSDFLDSETLTIVSKFFNNISKDLIYHFLKKMTDDNIVDVKKINWVIENILIESFSYLKRNNVNIEQREYLPKALVMIKNYWSSSKVDNPNMKDVKEYLFKTAKDITNKKTAWVLSSLSLIYIVFVFLRSTKK